MSEVDVLGSVIAEMRTASAYDENPYAQVDARLVREWVERLEAARASGRGVA